jgi:protein pelota
MKADYCEMKRSSGEIRLFPETLDDLWHLRHLIHAGDLVFAVTFRSPDAAQDRIRPEKLEKRPVRLGIRVQKVEFDQDARRLRISGLIEHGPDSGCYHTIQVETRFEISVIKIWTRQDLERIERAVKQSLYDAIHILAIEEGEAVLFRMRQSGPQEIQRIVLGSGKGDSGGGRTDFFERVLAGIAPISGPLVVAGPGFVKEEFIRFARNHGFETTGRVVVADTRRSGLGAIRDVVGLGVLENLTGDLQLRREVELLEEFLLRIAQGRPAAYGTEEVMRAIEAGAVEWLLVVDVMVREPGISPLIEKAESMRSQVVVFSSEFEPGEQLLALGGIAALLRFMPG